MRIVFNTSTTETLAYLRTVETVLEHNKAVSDEVQAYKALKELVLSVDKRLSTLEDERRKNRVCR